MILKTEFLQMWKGPRVWESWEEGVRNAKKLRWILLMYQCPLTNVIITYCDHVLINRKDNGP